MTGNLITTARQELNSSLPLAYAPAVPPALADESVTKSSVHQLHPGAPSDLVFTNGNGNTGQSQQLDVLNINTLLLSSSSSYSSSPSSIPASSSSSSPSSSSTFSPFTEHPFIQNAGTANSLPSDSHSGPSHHHSNTDEELWINVRIAVGMLGFCPLSLLLTRVQRFYCSFDRW